MWAHVRHEIELTQYEMMTSHYTICSHPPRPPALQERVKGGERERERGRFGFRGGTRERDKRIRLSALMIL